MNVGVDEGIGGALEKKRRKKYMLVDIQEERRYRFVQGE
jgi:hypothetical protein